MTIISLGGNCAITYHLNQYNLRNHAFPFDWCKITINQLINVLSNNFTHFEHIKIKKLSQNHLKNGIDASYLLYNMYNITFAHEVSKSEEIYNFSNKLVKRIERFKNLINPTFIRLEIFNIKNIEIYNELIYILDNMFNTYTFILISKNDPNINKIKWIKLDDFSEDWKYNNINWLNILQNYN